MTQVAQNLTGAEEVIWNLGDLYASTDDPAIGRDQKRLDTLVDEFVELYRGKVATLTPAQLAESLTALEEISDQIMRLGAFASLNWVTDTGSASKGALLQKIQEYGSEISQKLVFFELEWANIPEEHAKITTDPALARWRHFLEHALESRPHLLSEPEERLLTEKSVTGAQAWNRYFGQVLSATEYELDGQKVPQELVLRQLYMPEREARLRAADSMTAGLRENLKTATFVFNTLLADKASNDRLRKYSSWIAARNLNNEISDQAVEALVNSVTARYATVGRYYQLKRKLLGLDQLYDYDRYAPLMPVETHYQWDEAREIVLNAYNAFHPRMAEIAGEFFEKNWIHAPVLPGKRGGAFASQTATTNHPYILVNFSGRANDVMTLAHELGHGIHMYLSRPKGSLEADSPLTTAEMASTFGEMLVFTDLMNREPDPQVRSAMLASKIESTFATIYRQISMNRFEDAIHTARRTEGELSPERLGELWLQTQQAMFGKSVTLREDYGLWWSYVTHFTSSPGYVYAYAFGELLVLALFNKYKHEGATFVPKYLDVLTMGGSDRPENILKRVGVDLTDPNFWDQGLTILDDMVAQLEQMIASR